MRVLGVETSCDETGIAIYDTERGLLAHALYSQISMHQEYGGVVPELASRDHIQRLIPLTRSVLAQAATGFADLDGIAYTAGPGLLGAVLTGASFACSLAYALDLPTVAVHHMEAHLLAPMLADRQLRPPFVALLISGGHTMLVGVRAFGAYQVLGETLDDAAGEAFDKTAQVLGLPYPGGPHLMQLAAQGDPKRHSFARPLTDRPGMDFSFSGLKTQVMLAARKSNLDLLQVRADLASGFEQAVADTLAFKCARALDLGYRSLVVAGGVGANLRIRQQLDAMAARKGASVHYPPLAFCTDNGAMVALAGALRLRAGERAPSAIQARARWPLQELSPFECADP